jgi:hypothetical protein
LKALFWISVTVSGILMVCSEVQALNALSPMNVTFLPR